MVPFGFVQSLKNLVASYRGWKSYLRLPASQRRITFFSEDISSWAFLGPLVEELAGSHSLDVAYLTSVQNDPRLQSSHPRIRSFYLGEGLVRTWAFFQMPGPLLVMTMPDLENLYLKRSKAARVHYTHIFHSMVSSHMTYRPGAFDHFDSVFCVGPHHIRELKARRAQIGQTKPHLIEHGYARLDAILASRETSASPEDTRSRPCILVAPSWGPHGLLETQGIEVTEVLLQAGFEVIVRPHPHTWKTNPGCLKALETHFANRPHFTLERDVSTTHSLEVANIMLSDWSGAAFDFAFGYETPVVFLDLPRKVNNPDYQSLHIEPLEVTLREKIGTVVPLHALETLPQVIREQLKNPANTATHFRTLREEHIFHVGRSASVGAEKLLEILNTLKA